jgi:hypothetical protein
MSNGVRPADRDEGAPSARTASPAELRRALPNAPPAYLEEALENPAMGEAEVLLLLRNRGATPALLTRIGKDRKWSAPYAAKKGIVRHAHTPAMIARDLLAHLQWADLAEIAEDALIPVPVRRHADALVRVRLPELAVGERVALARRAGRDLIRELSRSKESGVLLALLGNPKLTDADAEAVAARPDAPSKALRGLADHPRWGAPLTVRVALARNPASPIAVALRLVASLPLEDLSQVIDDERAPTIVRVSAERRLRETTEEPRTGGSG